MYYTHFSIIYNEVVSYDTDNQISFYPRFETLILEYDCFGDFMMTLLLLPDILGKVGELDIIELLPLLLFRLLFGVSFARLSFSMSCKVDANFTASLRLSFAIDANVFFRISSTNFFASDFL